MNKDETQGLGKLSEQEERLLGAYHDGECGLFGKWRARRLLAARPEAGKFIRALASTAEGVVAVHAHSRNAVDSSGKINVRLEQEEHAAVFLGKRRLESASGVWKIKWMRPLSWGLSGALASGAAAAAVFLQFSPQMQTLQVSNGAAATVPVPAGGSSGYSTVRLDPSSSNQGVRLNPNNEEGREFIPQAQLGRVPRVMEVDWMRSRGRVRMIQDPGEKAAILWVNRSQQNQALTPQRQRGPVDETPGAQPRAPIRMLEENVPRAFSAYDR